MAAALPRGIAEPARNASWATSDDDAVWVLVKDGHAYLYRSSGRAFFSQVASSIGVPAPTTMTTAFLRAFRNAMTAAAQDVRQVSETTMTKETLRAMAWWISENEGRRDGTPGTRIWFPNGNIAVPPVGAAIPDGPAGGRSVELRASTSQGNGGGAVILGGGGSGNGGSSGNGGGSGGSGSSSGGRSSSSSSSSGSGVAAAAMTGGKVLVVGALVVGAVVAAARVAQGRNPLDQPALPWRAPTPSKSGAPMPPTTPAPRAPRERGAPSNASAAVRAALKGGA